MSFEVPPMRHGVCEQVEHAVVVRQSSAGLARSVCSGAKPRRTPGRRTRSHITSTPTCVWFRSGIDWCAQGRPGGVLRGSSTAPQDGERAARSRTARRVRLRVVVVSVGEPVAFNSARVAR